eukprot:CAMPEP_0202703268 /NCGR_PEP_ID=MMETSP1385-20130828/16132_1 /ASSEMBLY_ACC=CAM_ASM_000861 /TAXON_ID=933848 /ORGANISM="Elphidium margaritaceum" /LENGTH=280 /DNA_ID=CAMNT_0049361091 /DNA_START=44 /DNA_END=886 /DNA_ORIENTATION=-
MNTTNRKRKLPTDVSESDATDASSNSCSPSKRVKYDGNIRNPKQNPAPALCDFNIKFESVQIATNTNIEADYVADWSAELRLVHELIFSDSVPAEFKLAHPDVDMQSFEEKGEFAIGTASFSVIQMGRLCNAGAVEDDFFVALDAHSQELEDLMPVLDMKNPGIFEDSKQDQGMNEGGSAQDVVLLRRVNIIESFRGNGYGKCLAQRIIDNFGTGQCRIVVKPYPLQWEGKEDDEFDENQFQQDKRKVIAVWESMGFRQIGNSEFWGRNQAFMHPRTICE